MERTQRFQCPCPNIKCELHGKCKECRASHGGKSTYCKLSNFRKKINNLICKIIVR